MDHERISTDEGSDGIEEASGVGSIDWGSIDWEGTTFGSRRAWPHALEFAAGIVFSALTPMVLVWGPYRSVLYNDAATPIVDQGLYAAHRGTSLAALPDEIREPLREVVEKVSASGRAAVGRSVRTMVDLTGFKEKIVHLSASPIGDLGTPAGGVLVVASVETGESVKSPVSALRLIDQVRQLADGLPQMVAFLDTDLRYTFRNDAHRAWVDLPDELVVGHMQTEVLGAAAHEQLSEYVATALSGKSIHFETSLSHPSGETRIVEADYVPHRAADGSVAGFFIIARDITGARQQSDELLRSRERLRLILDSALEYAIILLDNSGSVTSWNGGAERLLGYAEDEVIGKDGSIFFTEEDRARGLPQHERALSRETGKAANDRWHVRKDGSRFWGSGTIMPLASGGGFLKILRDRTDEREALEATARARLRAEIIAAEQAALLGQLTEGVIVTDPIGRITFINRSAAELHGVAHLDISPDEYADKFQLFRENGEVYPSNELPLARAVQQGESIIDARWRIRRPDGSEILAIGSAKPVIGPNGETIGNVLTVRDDTARKTAEDRRNLLINELNHRVKNTLATVQSIASQTFRAQDVGRQLRSLFESRLVALSNTHNILNRESWEGAGLGEVVRQSILPFNQTEAPRINAAGSDIRCSTKAALALAMALHELATNAVKYGALSNADGHVTIDWSVDPATGTFVLNWREEGGPPVQPPTRQGFGSRLVGRSLAGELGGDVELDFAPDGLRCTIVAPMSIIGVKG